MIPSLQNGAGAFIAASLTKTLQRQTQVAFSKEYMTAQPHLVVHRRNQHLKRLEDLSNITIHVPRGTSYQELLERLMDEGYQLQVKLHDNIPTEELIQQVEEGRVEATIANSNIVFLNRRYHPRITIMDAIGPAESLAWAVHPNARRLLKKINAFFEEIQINGVFQKIYNRYYAYVDEFDSVDLRTFHWRVKTRLPHYLSIIQEAAEKHAFDWRLIAAQMCQESHFNPEAKSHAGVMHLRNMYDLFSRSSGSDRLFMTLAAYNIGQGHIQDARNLAHKMNLDPNNGSSLTKTLPLLSKQEFYKNATYGYCRGGEPIEYVKQIMIYYDILRHDGIEYRTQQVPSYPSSNRAA